MIKKLVNKNIKNKRRRSEIRNGNCSGVRASSSSGIRTGSFALALMLAVVMLLSMLTACSPAAPGEEQNPTANTPTNTYKELPSPAGNIEPGRGTLRLWWQKPESYSPLLPATVPQKGIYSLLYQPLFTVSDNGYLEGVIAEDYLWSEDRLTLKVNIREDILFSDGTVLEAEDVRSSVLSWKNNEGWLNTDPEDVQTGINDTSASTPGDNNGSDKETAPTFADETSEGTSFTESQTNEGNSEEDIDGTAQTTADSGIGEGAEAEESDYDANAGESDSDADAVESDSDAAGVPVPSWDKNEASDLSELVFLPRKEAIQSIREIVTVDDSIEIRLSGRCDNLPDFLNTPIIPAEYTQGVQWELPPGTGSWYCQDFFITGELKLAQTDGRQELTVMVNVYDSAKSAMLAFINGDLDLLLLSASSWPRYGGARDIRSRKMPNGQFAYLQVNTDKGALSDNEYYEAMQKAFLRSNLTTDMPAGSWLYSPQPEKDIHPYLPMVSVVKAKMQELTAEADLDLLRAEPIKSLLLTWPEQSYLKIVGEEVRLQLRTQNIPVVREGESLMPEETTETEAEPVATEAATPTPTLDPNLIVLPDETTSPETQASSTETYYSGEIPTSSDLELAISSADYPEPYLFYKYLPGADADDEALAILKESYWKRLRLDSSATIKANPETESVSLLAATMALVELADAGSILGLALPSDVICFGAHIEGVVGTKSDSPYEGLEDLIIWPQ